MLHLIFFVDFHLKSVYLCRMDIAAMSLVVACEKVVAERHHGMTRELQAWLKSCDDANATMMDFSKYYIIEEPCDCKEKKVFRRLVKEKKNILYELQVLENACRHALAMEIGFSVSKEEFRELDLTKPGQVIGWAITQGMSEIPERRARCGWFRETKGVLKNWAGSSSYQLKPNCERVKQIEHLIRFRENFPV